VVKVLIEVVTEHTWLWSKLRAGFSPANQARYVTAGDTDSHMHSSPYEYYIMYAALIKEVHVNRVRGLALDNHIVGPTERAMHQVDQCLRGLPDASAGGTALEDRWIYVIEATALHLKGSTRTSTSQAKQLYYNFYNKNPYSTTAPQALARHCIVGAEGSTTNWAPTWALAPLTPGCSHFHWRSRRHTALLLLMEPCRPEWASRIA
jgi:hypothetical protein